MKYNKNTLTVSTLICCSALHMNSALAGELSANVAATSNYLWRGLEQTQGKAAISGGLDLSYDSGFYMGTWASNADWAEGMTYELDLYAGFSGSLNDSIGYDFGFIYFAYPDEASGDADFSEIYANFSIQRLSVGVAVLADGEGGDFGDSLYVSADYSVPVAHDAELGFHVGSYTGDWLAEETMDFGINLNKNGFTFGLSKTDADGSAGDLKVYLTYAIDISL
ncbi:TorF family putative porin [Thalassotalea marina]|uniref:TIGR02001 family outer membrane protein n=1 Tax=Thalassotalea marina TaxID=1673741 RepID=A0A919BF45_9GAMM|nr:TorF family putative porin [Thalassotalea marina]GHF87399.1 hypothetical protein GCM10017161_13680 [Thalassotalea marina]